VVIDLDDDESSGSGTTKNFKVNNADEVNEGRLSPIPRVEMQMAPPAFIQKELSCC
jgi:hypothetical protein